MRISDWSSDVCSSDLFAQHGVFVEDTFHSPVTRCAGPPVLRNFKIFTHAQARKNAPVFGHQPHALARDTIGGLAGDILPLKHHAPRARGRKPRSEEHTSELQSLMRISYAVFCLKKKKT